MVRVKLSLVSAVLAALMAFSVAAAASSKQFEGRWSSELNYEGAKYTLELSLAPDEDGDITGNLRILESGYLVETLGLKSVELKGDSLAIQTNSIDGRAAKFSLARDEGDLSGLFWETSYSGDAQGEGMKMVFKPIKE